MTKIWSYIKLHDDNEIIYNEDDTRVSGIIDLLLYIITDSDQISTSIQPPPKPPYLKHFISILKLAGIKKSLLGSKRIKDEIVVEEDKVEKNVELKNEEKSKWKNLNQIVMKQILGILCIKK